MKRIGFHYIPDTSHYRKTDLDTWLPELIAMKTHWLVLNAPVDRAIPEPFIQGILDAKIQPVLHFHLYPDELPALKDLNFIFKLYARWGIKYITLFNKPNLRSSWKTSNWIRNDLVERFLDIYIPLAESCLSHGLTPIYPPLEPGGDYWDTVFLRASLRGLKRRKQVRLLEALVIGTIAKTRGRQLDWGTGGPERWPATIPYSEPTGVEDHQGFRIFDWYEAFIRSVLIEPKPIFLFEVESSADVNDDSEQHTRENLTIAQLLEGNAIPNMEPVPPEVIGSAFWLLAAPAGTKEASRAWYQPEGEKLPIATALQEWAAEIQTKSEEAQTNLKPIPHYLLLPCFDEEVSDVHLDFIRPFIKQYKPTIGFSIEEAKQAKKVTIIDGNQAFSSEIINDLRKAGCLVTQIDELAQMLHQ